MRRTADLKSVLPEKWAPVFREAERLLVLLHVGVDDQENDRNKL
jgi:hypothetical protein